MRVLEGVEKTLRDSRSLVETEVVEEVLQDGLVDDELGDVVVLRVGCVKGTRNNAPVVMGGVTSFRVERGRLPGDEANLARLLEGWEGDRKLLCLFSESRMAERVFKNSWFIIFQIFVEHFESKRERDSSRVDAMASSWY